MAGERILVVDDESNIRILLQEQLEPEGYEVTLVVSGEEALSCSATQAPDLASVDLEASRFSLAVTAEPHCS
jgi:CheY-like chemotaxis protein